MSEPRIKSGLWVSMALRLAEKGGQYGAILRKGDPDSGGILVVLRASEGLIVLSQVRAADGKEAWMRATGPEPVDQEAADAYLERATRRDPDLWVVEFNARGLTPPFEARIL